MPKAPLRLRSGLGTQSPGPGPHATSPLAATGPGAPFLRSLGVKLFPMSNIPLVLSQTAAVGSGAGVPLDFPCQLGWFEGKAKGTHKHFGIPPSLRHT